MGIVFQLPEPESGAPLGLDEWVGGQPLTIKNPWKQDLIYFPESG